MNKRRHGLKVFRQSVSGLNLFGVNICGPKIVDEIFLDINHRVPNYAWTKFMWT